jgi:hypothetical protein
MTPQILTATGLIIIATAASLIPHPPNFSPLAATALFAGAKFANKHLAFAVPFATLLLRDAIVGMHILMPFVYASYAITICLGFWLKRSRSAANVAVASALGSCIFFIITNFAVWLLLDTYSDNAAGLAACYVAGLPSFANAVAGDLFYTALLFGAFALAQTQLKPAAANA